MLRDSFRPIRFLIPLAAVLLLCVGVASTASAVTIWKIDEGDGHYSKVYVDDNGDVKSIHFYGPEDEYFGSIYFDSDPNPEGDDGGGTMSQDAIEQLEDFLKKYGGAVVYEEDSWNHLLNYTSAGDNDGPTVIDPVPEIGTLGQEDFGDGGSGTGFDPGVPIGEQIDKQKQQGSGEDDDEGGDDRDPPPEDINPDPMVIDPPPFMLLDGVFDFDGNGMLLLQDIDDGTMFHAVYSNGMLVDFEPLR